MPPTEEEVRIIGNAVIAEVTDQLSIPRIQEAEKQWACGGVHPK